MSEGKPDVAVHTPADVLAFLGGSLLAATRRDAAETGREPADLRPGSFAGFHARSHGPDFIEVEHHEGFVVLAWPALWQDAARLAPHLRRARAGYIPLVLLGSDEQFAEHIPELLDHQGQLSMQPLPLGPERLLVLLRNHRAACRLHREAAEGELLQDRYRSELDELFAIGRALSSERNTDKLLPLILQKMRAVTTADAGSVYIVERALDDASRALRFKVSQNDTVKLDFREFTLPVSKRSIVGSCVLGREVINIADLYRLDPPGQGNNPWGFSHNRDFDAKVGYQTRSMLTVPMIDAHEQVIGVIQLINRKRRPELLLQGADDFDAFVVPFDTRSQELAATLASQAGIALENANLYQEIQMVFEGFVRASVTAIESRDPTTSGHSQRVADLTVGLAKAADREDQGAYAKLVISTDDLKQIEYAALLHDFGKVGVREHVLVKAEKLYPHEKELLLARFDFVKKTLEAEHLAQKVRYLVEKSREEALAAIEHVNADLDRHLAELDELMAFVLKANQPTVLDQGGFERLQDIAVRTFVDARGAILPLLSPREMMALEVPRGSLTDGERTEIESHVVHTYEFLRRIPWGRMFKDIPEIAGAHHEKLDGSGYPRQLRREQIPIGAKMMTISDIYDALTASDRPYKRAVPAHKALDILGYEAKAGKCDAELLRLFIDAKIYELCAEKPR